VTIHAQAEIWHRFSGIFLLFASYRITVGPLYAYCCTKKDQARLTQILTPIANLSYSDIGGNLLHSAIYGSPEQVEFLLQKRVDPNGRDQDGKTPLIRAARFEKFDGETQKKMDLLLDYGADIWACDKEGNSVFFHATGNLDCLKYLISRCHNFDPFVVNYEGENLLFGAIKNERNDDPAVLQFLLSQGLDPNSPSFEWHYLPLEEACTFRRPRLVRTLLEAGAQYGSLTEFNTRHHLTPEIFEI
jgi:ankyrin repeat protein